MKKHLIALGAAALLSACGGSGSDMQAAADGPSSGGGAGNGNGNGSMAQDAFLATVTGTVAASSETGEPVSIDAAMPTSPEDKEPQPLG